MKIRYNRYQYPISHLKDLMLGKISSTAAFKWIVALAMAEWLSIPPTNRSAFITLITFMGVDMFTGLWAAIVNREISSEVGFKGISRKLGICFFLLFVHKLEYLTGFELNLDVAGAIGYSINEAISIVENLNRIGVQIPSAIVVALLHAKRLKAKVASQDDINELIGNTDTATVKKFDGVIETPGSSPNLKVNSTTTTVQHTEVTPIKEETSKGV